ncbi:NAD(P)-dependent oxidoreductase [Nocardiopsis lucentensis]|uniref:NAD(P)-dependent oxidoreductase n=1 Tax=Nocardiopsis lucentensis TaxID=53441 RepID=UPI00034D45B7|nr:NAD(P)-dependent oxidoreductase [Nocardiopsis lucentensis]
MTSLITVGLLHPGQMGAAVGHELTKAGVRVLWCPIGRSDASVQRAEEAGLDAVPELGSLLERSSVAISLCPPAAAEETAVAIREAGFSGLFVEANAISPDRAERIAADMAAHGARTVDGCVIGPPPGGTVATHLYLSGEEAELAAVKDLFAGTAVVPIQMEGAVGAASALKMAYGSYQKAACALAGVAQALGRAHGVDQHLTAEARRLAKSPLATPEYLTGVAAKAWRWAPEMREVAQSLAEVGLPQEMAEAAATVFDLWELDKDNQELPLPQALDRLKRD